MSRRESRVSMNVRQNDALFEFESFKKKFLLANKHITKLNSTLSVRIEELNAQISTLYVENLRLRASEIALSAQLKREREKSRKIIADAEAATASLSKHFGILRHTFNIRPVTPPPQSPPPSKARRPVLNSLPSPKPPRLARAPNVPRIFEDNECSSENDNNHEPSKTKTTSPTRRKMKTKPRLSASRLPLPLRVSPPPSLPIPTPLSNEVEGPWSNSIVTRKKPSRRQSGLLTVNASGSMGGSERVGNEFSAALPQPRPPSPAFGSPIRRNTALDDGEILDMDGMADLVGDVEGDGDEEPEMVAKQEKRKGKGKAKETGKERDLLIDLARPGERERKRGREEDEYTTVTVDGNKLKLKDVTNSPRSRSALPPSDTNAADRDRRQTSEADGPTSGFPTSTVVTAARTFISTPTTTPAPPQLLTPRASSSPVPHPPISETDGSIMNGRERRTRKSVNYAEPKLNTKMRKPDPLPGSTSSTKKRSSVAHAFVQSEDDVDEPAARSSIERESPPKSINGHSSSSSTSPFPPLPALPLGLALAYPPPSSRISAATTVKRKKSRPYLIPNDDDSDGAQADVDAEFSNSKGMGSGGGWVNVEGRRKSANVRKVIVAVGDVNGKMTVEVDDGRRHTMTV